jgi:hypothetical protein
MAERPPERESVVHTHRCALCGYVWQCTQPASIQLQHDICAICEALDRMRRETPWLREFSSR